MAAELAAEVGDDALIAEVQASGPGFLNIAVTDASLWTQLAARVRDPRLGVGESAHGQRMWCAPTTSATGAAVSRRLCR
ncbi:hypothetical protein [Nocardia sp. NPDC020380]|uniref:hypothetical protein n=1 Tax=Nocardia sp. NPDC020380 TaxID=3364309 RepID=UPI0037B8A628